MTVREAGKPVPLVSVVIPFRNAAGTLAECLDSLGQQTLQDFEALLLDDGSEDGSAEIVRARNDPRLRLLTPGRIGLVPALNLGISRSRSELIARMDADDIMHPDRLRRQSDFLFTHPTMALVACQVELFPEEAVRDGYREYIRWQNACLSPDDIASNMYVESPLAHPSVMMRRSAVGSVGGYADGDFPEDYDLWFRLHEAGFGMAKLPGILLRWRDGEGRASRVDARYGRKAFDRLRARYLARDRRLQTGRELVVWGGGRTTRMRVRHLLDQGVRVLAWVDVAPGRIGNSIWGLPVHPHEWLNRDPRPFVLVYVNNHGAREEIDQVLRQWGYIRGEDYLAVG
jgi:glycosyltransferase involved in cell wall biosynthesis